MLGIETGYGDSTFEVYKQALARGERFRRRIVIKMVGRGSWNVKYC